MSNQSDDLMNKVEEAAAATVQPSNSERRKLLQDLVNIPEPSTAQDTRSMFNSQLEKARQNPSSAIDERRNLFNNIMNKGDEEGRINRPEQPRIDSIDMEGADYFTAQANRSRGKEFFQSQDAKQQIAAMTPTQRMFAFPNAAGSINRDSREAVDEIIDIQTQGDRNALQIGSDAVVGGVNTLVGGALNLGALAIAGAGKATGIDALVDLGVQASVTTGEASGWVAENLQSDKLNATRKYAEAKSQGRKDINQYRHEQRVRDGDDAIVSKLKQVGQDLFGAVGEYNEFKSLFAQDVLESIPSFAVARIAAIPARMAAQGFSKYAIREAMRKEAIALQAQSANSSARLSRLANMNPKGTNTDRFQNLANRIARPDSTHMAKMNSRIKVAKAMEWPVGISGLMASASFGETANEVMSLGYEQLAKQSPHFLDLVNELKESEGLSHEDAMARAQTRMAGNAALMSAVVSGAIAAPTAWISPLGSRSWLQSKSGVKDFLSSVVIKEPVANAIQEGGGGFGINVGMKVSGTEPERALGQDVTSRAAEGALVGAGMAGVMGAPKVAAPVAKGAAKVAAKGTLAALSVSGKAASAVTEKVGNVVEPLAEARANKAEEATEGTLASTAKATNKAYEGLRENLDTTSEPLAEDASTDAVRANKAIDATLSNSYLDNEKIAQAASPKMKKALGKAKSLSGAYLAAGRMAKKATTPEQKAEVLAVIDALNEDYTAPLGNTFLPDAYGETTRNQLGETRMEVAQELLNEIEQIMETEEFQEMSAIVDSFRSSVLFSRGKSKESVAEISDREIAKAVAIDPSLVANTFREEGFSPLYERIDNVINNISSLGLSKEQVAAVKASFNMAKDAENLIKEASKATGNEKITKVVKDLFLKAPSDNLAKESLMSQMGKALTAMKNKDTKALNDILQDTRDIAQHMANKSAALNYSKQNKKGNRSPVVAYKQLTRSAGGRSNWRNSHDTRSAASQGGLYYGKKELADQVAAEARAYEVFYKNLQRMANPSKKVEGITPLAPLGTVEVVDGVRSLNKAPKGTVGEVLPFEKPRVRVEPQVAPTTTPEPVQAEVTSDPITEPTGSSNQSTSPVTPAPTQSEAEAAPTQQEPVKEITLNRSVKKLTDDELNSVITSLTEKGGANLSKNEARLVSKLFNESIERNKARAESNETVEEQFNLVDSKRQAEEELESKRQDYEQQIKLPTKIKSLSKEQLDGLIKQLEDKQEAGTLNDTEDSMFTNLLVERDARLELANNVVPVELVESMESILEKQYRDHVVNQEQANRADQIENKGRTFLKTRVDGFNTFIDWGKSSAKGLIAAVSNPIQTLRDFVKETDVDGWKAHVKDSGTEFAPFKQFEEAGGFDVVNNLLNYAKGATDAPINNSDGSVTPLDKVTLQTTAQFSLQETVKALEKQLANKLPQDVAKYKDATIAEKLEIARILYPHEDVFTSHSIIDVMVPVPGATREQLMLPTGYIIDPQIAEATMLSAIQWAVTDSAATSSYTVERAAKLLGMDEADVNGRLLDAMNKGQHFKEALNQISKRTIKYLELREKDEASLMYLSNVVGNLSAMAIETLERRPVSFNAPNGNVVNDSFVKSEITKGVYYTTDNQGKLSKNTISINSIWPTENFVTGVQDKLTLLPDVFDIAINGSRSTSKFVGEGNIPKARNVQLRNEHLDLSPKELAAVQNSNNIPFYFNNDMLNAIKDLVGKPLSEVKLEDIDGVTDLLGIKRINNLMPDGMKKTVEGQRIEVLTTLQEVGKFMELVDAHAEEAGTEFNKTPIYFDTSVTKVHRLQYTGRATPQSSTLMRHLMLPTQSTIKFEMTDAGSMGLSSDVQPLIYTALAQGLFDEKIFQKDPVEWVSIIQERMASDQLKAAIGSIKQGLGEDATQGMGEAIKAAKDHVRAYNRAYPKEAIEITPLALHNLVEYAKLEFAMDSNLLEAETDLYIEQDGINNGVINSIMLMSRGSDTEHFVRTVQTGGVTFGNTASAKELYEESGGVDTYGLTTRNAPASIIKQRESLGVYGKEHGIAAKAVDTTIHYLMKGAKLQTNPDGTTQLAIDRGAVKYRVLEAIYGSGINGSARADLSGMVEQMNERVYLSSLIRSVLEGKGDITPYEFNRLNENGKREYATTLMGPEILGRLTNENRSLEDVIEILETGDTESLAHKEITAEIVDTLNNNPEIAKQGASLYKSWNYLTNHEFVRMFGEAYIGGNNYGVDRNSSPFHKNFEVNSGAFDNASSIIREYYSSAIRNGINEVLGEDVLTSMDSLQQTSQFISTVYATNIKVRMEEAITRKQKKRTGIDVQNGAKGTRRDKAFFVTKGEMKQIVDDIKASLPVLEIEGKKINLGKVVDLTLERYDTETGSTKTSKFASIDNTTKLGVGRGGRELPSMGTSITGDSGVSAQANGNIALGDAAMIANLFQEEVNNVLQMFDGINLSMGNAVEYGTRINKAQADAWQTNHYEALLKLLEKAEDDVMEFVNRAASHYLPLDQRFGGENFNGAGIEETVIARLPKSSERRKTDEGTLSNLIDLERPTPMDVIDFYDGLKAKLGEYSTERKAFLKALNQVGISSDQMAALGTPYYKEGTDKSYESTYNELLDEFYDPVVARAMALSQMTEANKEGDTGLSNEGISPTQGKFLSTLVSKFDAHKNSESGAYVLKVDQLDSNKLANELGGLDGQAIRFFETVVGNENIRDTSIVFGSNESISKQTGIPLDTLNGWEKEYIASGVHIGDSVNNTSTIILFNSANGSTLAHELVHAQLDNNIKTVIASDGTTGLVGSLKTNLKNLYNTVMNSEGESALKTELNTILEGVSDTSWSNLNTKANKPLLVAALQEIFAYGRTDSSVRKSLEGVKDIDSGIKAAIKKVINKFLSLVLDKGVWKLVPKNTETINNALDLLDANYESLSTVSNTSIRESSNNQDINTTQPNFQRSVVDNFFDTNKSIEAFLGNQTLTDAEEAAVEQATDAAVAAFNLDPRDAANYRNVAYLLSRPEVLNSGMLAEVGKLRGLAIENLKVSDFSTLDPNEAQLLLDVFRDADHPLNTLESFVALSIGNSDLGAALASLDLRSKTRARGINKNLVKLGDFLVNKASDLSNGTDSKDGTKLMESAFKNLTPREQGLVTKVTNIPASIANRIQEEFKKAQLAKKVGEKVKDSEGFIGTTTKIAAKAIETNREGEIILKASMNLDRKLGDVPVIGGTVKAISSFLKELPGLTNDNKDVYRLIKSVTFQVDQVRQHFKTKIPSLIREKFGKDFSKKDQKALADVVRGGGIASAVGNFSTEEVIDLILDPMERVNKRDAIKNTIYGKAANISPLMADYIFKKVGEFVEYKKSGTASDKLLKNAEAILSNPFNEVSVKGSRQAKALEAERQDLVELTNELLGVEMMDSLSDSAMDDFRSLHRSNKKAVEDYITYLSAVNNYMDKEAQKSLTVLLNREYGYLPREAKSGNDVLVAGGKKGAELLKNGYVRGDKVAGGKNLHYYFTRHNPKASFKKGIVQVAQNTSYGIQTDTGSFTDSNTVPLEYGQAATNKVPVFKVLEHVDSEGNISQEYVVDRYEAVLPKKYQDLVYGTDDVINSIGLWQSRGVEEQLKDVVNEAVGDSLVEMYDRANSSDRKNFINIADMDSLSTVEKDAVSIIPLDQMDMLKDRFNKGGKVMVRRDMLMDVVGRRNASVSDIFNGTNDWSPTTQKAVKSVLTVLLGSKAVRVLMTGEDLLKTGTNIARHNIVMASVIVPAINAVSSFAELIANGVNPTTAAKEYPRILKELEVYYNQRDRITEIEYEQSLLANTSSKYKRLESAKVAAYQTINNLRIKYLIDRGELNTIADLGVDKDDSNILKGRIGEVLSDKFNNLPPKVQGLARQGLMTKDTAMYKLMEKVTLYGDFIPKQILYEKKLKEGLSPEEAGDFITDAFVHYDRMAGRTRNYLEDIGAIWFFNWKLRSVKLAARAIKHNPLYALAVGTTTLPMNSSMSFSENVFSRAFNGNWGSSFGFDPILNSFRLNPVVQLFNML